MLQQKSQLRPINLTTDNAFSLFTKSVKLLGVVTWLISQPQELTSSPVYVWEKLKTVCLTQRKKPTCEPNRQQNINLFLIIGYIT